VVKRWSKCIKDGQLNRLEKSRGDGRLVCSSVWSMQMIMKMNLMLAANEQIKNSKVKCEKYFNKLKELVELDVRYIRCEGDENAGNKIVRMMC